MIMPYYVYGQSNTPKQLMYSKKYVPVFTHTSSGTGPEPVGRQSAQRESKAKR